jgi:hypothetical protein
VTTRTRPADAEQLKLFPEGVGIDESYAVTAASTLRWS